MKPVLTRNLINEHIDLSLFFALYLLYNVSNHITTFTLVVFLTEISAITKVKGVIGGQVFLHCNYDSTLDIETIHWEKDLSWDLSLIYWPKDGNTEPPNHDRRYSINETHLSIYSLTPSDAGIYICTVTSPLLEQNPRDKVNLTIAGNSSHFPALYCA